MEVLLTMRSIEELHLKSDNELDELVAIAQGWKSEKLIYTTFWVDSDNNVMHEVDRYHPTKVTTEGKAQCWDLMVKCMPHVDVDPVSETETECTVFNHKQVDDKVTMVADKNPQRAVVIAAILSAQGGSNDKAQ